MIRLANGFLTLSKTRRGEAKQEIHKLQKEIKDDHAQIGHDERTKRIREYGEAVRKARNWLIIASGSLCILIASIYDAVSG